jgi:predicted ABC-type ATPase
MIVIAGPSGSGKSTHFAANRFRIAFFNVDDRCALLNGGSYHAIPAEIRTQAQHECERFINDCTAQGTSFAVETTLGSAVAIDQAERARIAGFTIKMIFVATGNVQENVHRVVLRGLDGGHSAPAERIVEIYQRSLANLPRAIAVFDEVAIYDRQRPRQTASPDSYLQRAAHHVRRAAGPLWLTAAVGDG